MYNAHNTFQPEKFYTSSPAHSFDSSICVLQITLGVLVGLDEEIPNLVHVRLTEITQPKGLTIEGDCIVTPEACEHEAAQGACTFFTSFRCIQSSSDRVFSCDARVEHYVAPEVRKFLV